MVCDMSFREAQVFHVHSPKLLTGQERRNLRQIDPTLIFSAKEATYKLLYPLFGVYVDFLDVEISLIEKKLHSPCNT